MKYVIEPRLLKFSEEAMSDFMKTYVHYPFEELQSGAFSQTRFKRLERGVFITTTVKGELGQFSLYAGLTALTISFALLKMGQIFVNTVLTAAYGLPHTSHVNLMYDFY